MNRKRTLSNEINAGAKFLALLLILSYVLSLGAREHWALDLLRHFMHQYFIGGLILAPIFFWQKKLIFATAVTLITCMSFYEIYSRTDIIQQPRQDATQTLKIVTYNRRYKMTDHTAMKDWLIKEKPDIFVIQEARDLHVQTLLELQKTYPYQVHKPRQNAFGLILASKHTIVQSSTHKTTRYALDNIYVHALIELPNGEMISVYTGHPPPPTSTLLQKQRNEDLKMITKTIQEDPHENIIFMGDWNITSYSPYFQDLLDETGLKNQYHSFYPFPTWPSPFLLPIFQIPIDHILHKGNLELLEKRRTDHMGSDHYPVVALFSLPQMPKATLE